MIGAIRQKDGKYELIDIKYYCSTISTWSRRKQIKELGGIWNPDKNRWTNFPEDKLKEIGASKRLKIRVKPYNGYGVENGEDRCCYEYEIKNNQVRVLTWSDDREWVEIEKIYGEE